MMNIEYLVMSIKRKIKYRLSPTYKPHNKTKDPEYHKKYMMSIRRTKTYYGVFKKGFIKPRNINEKKIFGKNDWEYLYKLNGITLFN